ncbi:unnamed protein product [Alopecurus aequalis]
MRTHSMLLVTIVLVICIIATTTMARDITGVSGAWQQISNFNDPKVLEIARWAVDEHDRQENDGLQFKRVVSGMLQVVEGKNYNLHIDTVKGDGNEGIYIAEVYDVPWTHTRTLDSFRPAN